MTWTDVIEYGPGWAACLLLPLSWYYQAKWAREEQADRERRTNAQTDGSR